MKGETFRKILGSLLYLVTRTRFDLYKKVSILGKFKSDPEPRHWIALKYVLKYLKGTTAYEIFIPNGEKRVTFVTYSDKDWDQDESHRHYRSGYLLNINATPVTWK